MNVFYRLSDRLVSCGALTPDTPPVDNVGEGNFEIIVVRGGWYITLHKVASTRKGGARPMAYCSKLLRLQALLPIPNILSQWRIDISNVTQDAEKNEPPMRTVG